MRERVHCGEERLAKLLRTVVREYLHIVPFFHSSFVLEQWPVSMPCEKQDLQRIMTGEEVEKLVGVSHGERLELYPVNHRNY